MTWGSAVGGAFWDIGKFANDSGIDHEDDAFCAWWEEKKGWILDRVCEYKRAAFLDELEKCFEKDGLTQV